MSLKLSEQAMGAIMMALQKSLMEQSDIVPVLQNMEWHPGSNGKLYVENPPVVKTEALEEDEDA
tara:strand:+ start:389 stop:580 length:192 start_codon:yes stop_codon:yes gene_type:complete